MDFTKEYDVVVVGGGVAGCAAALQASRCGCKTALLEKSILLGGLATAGLVYIYLPLCDGRGHQVTFGISEELLHASMKYGPGDVPPNWREGTARYECTFAPASLALALEELLEEAGCDIWYDTLLTGVEIANGAVIGVHVANESGQGLLRTRQCVDASGSAIALRRAGVPCHAGENYLTMWALHYSQGKHHPVLGDNLVMEMTTARNLEAKKLLNASPELLERLFGPQTTERYLELVTGGGQTGKELSAFARQSHRMLRETLKMKQASPDGRKQHWPLVLPSQAQLRTIYAVDGAYTLKDGEEGVSFADSIGLAADWRSGGEGKVWEIPYRCLLPAEGADGILAAGRCIAAQGDAWEITRVIPAAAMTGQVAGLAAALALETGRTLRQLDASVLQEHLVRLGFMLHVKDLRLESDA